MSRRVCETCQWFATGEYEHGICAYRNGVVDVDLAMALLYSAGGAAERIRTIDDTCKCWEREEEDERWARALD